MDKTVTIELTMPKSIYKRYVKVAKQTKDNPVAAIALALQLMIEPLESGIKHG